MAEKVAHSAFVGIDQGQPEESTSGDVFIEEDNRPETSPYLEPAITFLIGPSRVGYTVPQHYARQSPERAFPQTSFNIYGTHKRTIALPEVEEEIGHTLVHYLYTGDYQTLKQQGISGPPDSKTEYRRAILVYCASKSYGLDSLAEHAIRNMELFDQGLSNFQILDIIRDIYPKLLKNDVWLPEYLRTKIEAAFEVDETIFAQERFLNYIGEATNFNKALVKIMVGIYTDKVTRMAKKVCKGQECLLESPNCSKALLAEQSGSVKAAEEFTRSPVEEPPEEYHKDCAPPPPRDYPLPSLVIEPAAKEPNPQALAEVTLHAQGLKKGVKDKKEKIKKKEKVEKVEKKEKIDNKEKKEVKEKKDKKETKEKKDKKESKETKEKNDTKETKKKKKGKSEQAEDRELTKNISETNCEATRYEELEPISSENLIADCEQMVVPCKVDLWEAATAEGSIGWKELVTEKSSSDDSWDVAEKPTAITETTVAKEPGPEDTILVSHSGYDMSGWEDWNIDVVGDNKKEEKLMDIGEFSEKLNFGGYDFGFGKIEIKNTQADLSGDEQTARKAPEMSPTPVEEHAAWEPPTLASLEGKMLENDGTILDDDGRVIGRLVEGLAKLRSFIKYKAVCNAEGQVVYKGRVMKKTKLEIILQEKEESAEPEKTNEVDDLDERQLEEGQKKGQRQIKLPVAVREEPEPEDADLMVLPLEPDVEQSSVCPFRARHILDGDSWKSCQKCRAMIRQISIQLAYEGNLDAEKVDGILLR